MMLFFDVNICLYALRPGIGSEAARVRDWVNATLAGSRPVALSPVVLSAMVRIATNPAVFANPTPPDEAVAFADHMLAAPVATTAHPGQRHWRIFSDLVTSHRLRGNDVPDAYLAAMALDAGATMVTRDTGFRRFAQLRVLDPLA